MNIDPRFDAANKERQMHDLSRAQMRHAAGRFIRSRRDWSDFQREMKSAWNEAVAKLAAELMVKEEAEGDE